MCNYSSSKGNKEILIRVTNYNDETHRSVSTASSNSSTKDKIKKITVKKLPVTDKPRATSPMTSSDKIKKSKRLKRANSRLELRMDFHKDQIIADLLHLDFNDPHLREFLEHKDSDLKDESKDSMGSPINKDGLACSLQYDYGLGEKCSRFNEIDVKDTCFISTSAEPNLTYDYALKERNESFTSDAGYTSYSNVEPAKKDCLKVKRDIRYDGSYMKSRKWKGPKGKRKFFNEFYSESQLRREEVKGEMKFEKVYSKYWQLLKMKEIVPDLSIKEQILVKRLLIKFNPFLQCSLFHSINYFFGGTILNLVPWLLEFENTLIKSTKRISKESDEIGYLDTKKSEEKCTIDVPTNYPLFSECECEQCKFCSDRRKCVVVPKIPTSEKDFRASRRPFVVQQHYFQHSKIDP